MDGKIKFTEQGEVITYRYGNAQTAAYELTVSCSSLVTLVSCQGIYCSFDAGSIIIADAVAHPDGFSRLYIQTLMTIVLHLFTINTMIP